MEEQVWGKISQFLKELHCEDTGRESYCETPEFKKVFQEKGEKSERYQECIETMQPMKRAIIEDYIEAIEECASEECHQAYIQGYIDCVLALYSIGILKPRIEIENIIDNLKN